MQIIKKRIRINRERFIKLYHFRDLFSQLVSRDIKLKYRRSFLGYVWSVLNPLLIMTVQAVVFSVMFKRPIEHFPAYLIAGNTLFNFMKESSGNSIRSITGNASLLKKTYVPKYIFTLSKVTSDLVNMFFSFGAMIIVLIATEVPFTWYALLFFIPVVELYVFCVGLGLFLAQAAVFFRDIQYIWSVVTTAWMYLTPLFYDLEALPTKAQWIVSHFNPMYYYISQFRAMTVYGEMPELWTVLYGAAIAFLMLLIGIGTFNRNKNRFILYI
jgi:lipopolysaccharide transport system permease protein